MTPRAYQKEAIRKVLAYAAEHPTGRLLLVIPTRGGKTLVGAMLVLMMVLKRGLRALWLVHREELLDEAVAHLLEVGIPESALGVIKSGRSSNVGARIQVASEATLDRRDKPAAHMVVTDEAHRDTAPRRRRLRRLYPKAFLLGLSATPKPPPQRDLGEDYDSLMVVVQPSELIHDGFLIAPVIYAPKRDVVPDFRGLRLCGGDYRADDLEPLLLRRSMLDDQVTEWARLADGRVTVAFPVTQAHSTALVARFRAAGIEAQHLDGNTPDGARAGILAGLREGRVPVVSSPGVLSEGTNLPAVKCVLNVRPTRSLTLYIQQSMRCGTPYGDERPIVLDVVGNVYEHGYPFADRSWSLINAESGQVIDPGAAILKWCEACGAMMPGGARACTACTRPFALPEPVIPDMPLILHEVEPHRRALAEERGRLLDYATQRQIQDPAGWVDRVLAAKYSGAGAEGAAA